VTILGAVRTALPRARRAEVMERWSTRPAGLVDAPTGRRIDALIATTTGRALDDSAARAST
jgi:hypothetical protein